MHNLRVARISLVADRLYVAGVADQLLRKYQGKYSDLTIQDIKKLRDTVKGVISKGISYDGAKIDIGKNEDKIVKATTDLILSSKGNLKEITSDTGIIYEIIDCVSMLSVLLYLRRRYPRYWDNEMIKWFNKDISSFKTLNNLKRHFEIHKDLLVKDGDGRIALRPEKKGQSKKHKSVDSLPTEAKVAGYIIKRIDSEDQIPSQDWTDLECKRKYCITTKNYFGEYGGPPYFWVLKKDGEKYVQYGMIIPKGLEDDPEQALRNANNTGMMEPELMEKLRPFLEKIGVKSIGEHGIILKDRFIKKYNEEFFETEEEEEEDRKAKEEALWGYKGLTERDKLAILRTHGNMIKRIENPSEEMQLAAVKEDIYAIRYILEKGIKPSKEVQLAAVKRWGGAIEYILKSGIKLSEEVQLAAVKENGNIIKHILESGIKPSEEVQLAAVRESGEAIRYIDNPIEEVQLAAVRERGSAIKYIENPSEEMQMVAIKESEMNIENIKNPTEKVQLITVVKNASTIADIKDPSEAVLFAAVKKYGRVIKYILENGIKPSERILLQAVREDGRDGHAIEEPAIKFILDAGIKPSEEILLEAVKENKDAVKFILEAGIKIPKSVKKQHKSKWNTEPWKEGELVH